MGERLPNDLLHNFDVDLQQFYFDVIKEERDIRKQWHAIGVRRALKDVIEAYSKRNVTIYYPYIRFDTPSKRCAYLMKYSPFFTSAVAKYLLELVRCNSYGMKDALKKGDLTICCLGGGPATDAVAVIRIVRAMYQPYWLKTRKALNVKVSVVDLSEDWRTTAENVLKYLKKSPKFIGVNEIELSYEFYMADLTKPFDAAVKDAIKSADIITMIYFLSAVNRSNAKDRCQPMVEKIMLAMKRDAFLFFLDLAADHHYKILNAAAEKRKTMREIYGPLVEEFHTISIASVEKFLELYSNYFHKFVCMTNIFLSVSSWYKPYSIEQRHATRKTISIAPPSWKMPTEEESDKLTREMKTYRKNVQRLVNARFRPINNKKQGLENRRKVVTENSVDSSKYHIKEYRTKPTDICDISVDSSKCHVKEPKPGDICDPVNTRGVPDCLSKCLPQTNSNREFTLGRPLRQATRWGYERPAPNHQQTGRNRNKPSSY